MIQPQIILAYFGDAWWHWLLLALALYPIGSIAMVALLSGYSACHLVVVEIITRTQMRIARRLLTRKQVRARVQQGEGTIVVDSPTIGWGITRAWWTDEDVLVRAPFPPPDREQDPRDRAGHPFDKWCYQEYTDKKHGRAFLFAVWNGKKQANRMRERCSNISIVETWSGGVVFAREQAKRVQEKMVSHHRDAPEET